MYLKSYKYNRTTRRKNERQLKRAIEKRWKHRKIVEANIAFNKITSELTIFGWKHETDFNNVVEHSGKWRITTSSALKLINEIYNLTLLPHKDGIEISRLEVWEQYQCQGYAGNMLDCLLQFLIQNGIKDFYLILIPAGMPENRSWKALDIGQLQRFYFKRGFRRQPKSDYWKLDISLFLNYLGNRGGDFELLHKNYSPKDPNPKNDRIININIKKQSQFRRNMGNNRAQ